MKSIATINVLPACFAVCLLGAAQVSAQGMPLGSQLSFEFYHYIHASYGYAGSDPACPSGLMCSDGTRLRSNAKGTLFFAPINGMTEMDVSDASFYKRAGRANSKCLSFE